MARQEKVGSVLLEDNEELRSFRESWRRELQHKTVFSEEFEQVREPKEGQANEWYRLASKAERDGNLGEAVRYYRQAFRANPNIEADTRQKIQEEISKTKANASVPTDSTVTENNEQSSPEPSVEDSGHFEEPISQWIPNPNEVHISHFPPEILLRVFSHIGDALSVERCSCVCKHFYRLSRDPPLWRQLCLQEWNIKVGNSTSLKSLDGLVRQYGWNWRRMFMERPRLRFDGIYISKNVYIRSGQTEGSYNQPFHQVVYFRYLVFHRSGKCTAALSFDPPKRFVSTALAHYLQPLVPQSAEDKGISSPSPAFITPPSSVQPNNIGQAATAVGPSGTTGNRIQSGKYTVNTVENSIHVTLAADRKTMPYTFHILLQLQKIPTKKQVKHQLIAANYYLTHENSEEKVSIDTAIKPYVFTKVPRHLLLL